MSVHPQSHPYSTPSLIYSFVIMNMALLFHIQSQIHQSASLNLQPGQLDCLLQHLLPEATGLIFRKLFILLQTYINRFIGVLGPKK